MKQIFKKRINSFGRLDEATFSYRSTKLNSKTLRELRINLPFKYYIDIDFFGIKPALEFNKYNNEFKG